MMPALASRAAVALLVVLAACGPPALPSGTPIPTVSIGPDDLSIEIRPDAMRGHLDALAAIAAENGGTRSAGTVGYAASVDYVVNQLRGMGYTVTTPVVDFTAFRELPGSTMTLEDGTTYQSGSDFRAMLYSAAADLTAPLATVGFEDSSAGVGEQGCDADDFAGFPAGAIAITPPGPCFRRQTVLNAVAAGAVGLIAVYPDREAGSALRPTLISPDGIDIPALTAVTETGDALLRAAATGQRLTLHVATQRTPTTAHSVIAETPGDGARVAMLGAHLDSVLDGPGINDDGSGVAAVLEIARAVSGGVPGGHVRFGFWAAEEYGLYGSLGYVQDVTSGDSATPIAYLNLDMIGSTNGVPLVYDDAQAPAGSALIRDYLVAALSAQGVRAELLDLGGASDHAAFQFAGIPTGGIFSGANEIKTDEQAGAFGGSADEPMDACYHLSCDLPANVNLQQAAIYAQAAAAALLGLADGTLLP